MDSPFIFRFASAASGSFSSRAVVEEQTNSNSYSNLLAQKEKAEEELRLLKEKHEIDHQKWSNEVTSLKQENANLKTELNESAEELNVVKERHQFEIEKWSNEVRDLQGDIINLKANLRQVELELDRILKREAFMVSLKEGESLRNKERYESTERDLKRLKKFTDHLMSKLEKSGGTGYEGTNGKGGNEGCVMEEERRSQTLESEVAEQTCNKDALISSRNEPEVSGQLLDGGNEGDVGPEVSGLLDVGNEGFVGPEVSGLLLDDKVQNVESDNLSIPDLPTLEARPHTSGKRDCHRLSREVNALKKSGVSKVLDTCTTRRYTRRMEREKASLEPVSETESSLDQASTAKIIPQEPRTRKRKQVENISNPDSPTLSTSRSKVPRVFREVEAIKKSKGASLTPDINLCTTGPRTRSMESKKASLEMLVEMTESRTRKRKEVEEHDAPRSSTSGSKAPKAKNTSPHNT